MLKLWVRISPVLVPGGVLLYLFELLYGIRLPCPGIHLLEAGAAMWLAGAAALTLPLWAARRRHGPLWTLAWPLKAWAWAAAALAAPAVVTLPLLAAFHLGCLPPYVVQLADDWGRRPGPHNNWWLLLVLPVMLWLPSRFGRPDPDAPRCPRCGYSLKGSQGLGCPECGLGRDDKTAANSDI